MRGRKERRKERNVFVLVRGQHPLSLSLSGLALMNLTACVRFGSMLLAWEAWRVHPGRVFVVRPHVDGDYCVPVSSGHLFELTEYRLVVDSPEDGSGGRSESREVTRHGGSFGVGLREDTKPNVRLRRDQPNPNRTLLCAAPLLPRRSSFELEDAFMWPPNPASGVPLVWAFAGVKAGRFCSAVSHES